MRTDKTICLNAHQYIEDRVYYGGGLNPTITASHNSYGNWVLYAEIEDLCHREDLEK